MRPALRRPRRGCSGTWQWGRSWQQSWSWRAASALTGLRQSRYWRVLSWGNRWGMQHAHGGHWAMLPLEATVSPCCVYRTGRCAQAQASQLARRRAARCGFRGSIPNFRSRCLWCFFKKCRHDPQAIWSRTSPDIHRLGIQRAWQATHKLPSTSRRILIY